MRVLSQFAETLRRSIRLSRGFLNTTDLYFQAESDSFQNLLELVCEHFPLFYFNLRIFFLNMHRINCHISLYDVRIDLYHLSPSQLASRTTSLIYKISVHLERYEKYKNVQRV